MLLVFDTIETCTLYWKYFDLNGLQQQVITCFITTSMISKTASIVLIFPNNRFRENPLQILFQCYSK